jgi:DNA-binding transcriptional regulator YiaG
MNNPVKYAAFNVHIPNLEGDAASEIVPVIVPVTIDPHTGEELLTPEAIELIETTKARYMGLLLPGEIREMRERLGLTQKQISTLLQAGEKSYTRWESGRARPSRMVNVLLRLLYEGRISVDVLGGLNKPSPELRLPATVRSPSRRAGTSASYIGKPEPTAVTASLLHETASPYKSRSASSKSKLKKAKGSHSQKQSVPI